MAGTTSRYDTLCADDATVLSPLEGLPGIERQCKMGPTVHMLTKQLAAIESLKPNLSPRSRAVLEAILVAEGPVGSMETVARHLGLRNRFALDRLLRHDGVPRWRRFAGWVSVLSWVQIAERDGTPLFRIAFRSHRHPSACYRLVKEISGLRWGEVRARGSEWVERQLLREFHRPHVRGRRAVPA